MGKIEVAGSGLHPDTPSHLDGISEGDETGDHEKQPGHLPDEHAIARRCSGVRAENRNPIRPSMPNPSPS